VAEDRIDPTDQIPEADLLDQRSPLEPHPLIERAEAIPDGADEADQLEQQAPGEDEDDYPRDQPGARWS
jgi:hypothetical protein